MSGAPMPGEYKIQRITVRQIKRRTPQEVTELARDVITRRKMVTDDPEAIRCAFLIMMTLMPPLTEAASKAVAAFIGDYSEITGQTLNGYPMFTSIGFLHRLDVGAYNSEIRRMKEALGIEAAESSGE